MDALRRQNIGGGRRSSRGTRWRRGRNSGGFISALAGNAPDATALIVRDIQRPIGPDRQSGWAVCRSTGLLYAPAKPSANTTNGPEGLPSANGWNTTL